MKGKTREAEELKMGEVLSSTGPDANSTTSSKEFRLGMMR